MKTLFINPPYTNFEGLKESAGHMMPLSFGYLAAYARKQMDGLKFKILDAEAIGLTYEEIRKRISNYYPHVVAITTPTPAVKHVYKIARITKEIDRNIHVVLGGIHPSVMPERTLRECSAIDFIVVGEGEDTLYRLLAELRSNSDYFEGIDGIWFHQNGKISRTKKKNLIKNLDSIPFPARDLYELDLYQSAPTKKVSDENATPILTSRGCPYNCIHCPSKSIWHRTVRYRSASNVVQEIEECVGKYNLREFNFFDDTFTINKKRVIDICNKIKEREMNIHWICFATTDAIDDELIQHMQSAGCRKISFGLESGDQKILDLMRKRTTINMGRKAVQKVRRYGIPVHASFMLGNVGETEASIQKTINFATNLDLDNATFFITTPFPGTDLYDVGKKLGNITEDTPWENFAPLTNAPPILVQDNLTAGELVYWQKKAFRKFYLRPRYMLKKFRLLVSIDGIRMLFEGLRILLRILKKDR